MISPHRRRQAIALLAAYAMALQALLSAALVAGSALPGDPLGVLCSHDAADGNGMPAGHDLPCAVACAAHGHGISGPLPPDAVVGMAQPRPMATKRPLADWRLPRLTMRGPQVPRGPPLA